MNYLRSITLALWRGGLRWRRTLRGIHTGRLFHMDGAVRVPWFLPVWLLVACGSAMAGEGFRIQDSVPHAGSSPLSSSFPSPLSSSSPEPAAHWRLAAEAQVDSRGMVLSQFITAVHGAPVPELQIGFAPAPGRVVTLTRGQIAEALARLAPGGSFPLALAWSGAEQVRITRRLRSLEEEEVRRELTAALQREHVRDRGELELRFTRPWSAVSIADEPFTVKVLDLPAAGVSPSFIVRFELRPAPAGHAGHGAEPLGSRPGGTSLQWQVAVQARVWREVWVAGSALSRGQLATEADLVRERRDVLTLRDALPALPLEDGNLELAENVAAGLALTARSLRARPVIKRGKVVDAVVADGAMLISVKVEALEDGLPGQFVRVRNVKSRREFRGKVQNEATIVVHL